VVGVCAILAIAFCVNSQQHSEKNVGACGRLLVSDYGGPGLSAISCIVQDAGHAQSIGPRPIRTDCMPQIEGGPRSCRLTPCHPPFVSFSFLLPFFDSLFFFFWTTTSHRGAGETLQLIDRFVAGLYAATKFRVL